MGEVGLLFAFVDTSLMAVGGCKSLLHLQHDCNNLAAIPVHRYIH